MATYAVGDVQGCYRSLRALLSKLRFKPNTDRLYFIGDLVNRGPRSADVVRFIADLGASASSILGNHDLNLLAIAAGVRPLRARDTVGELLKANDCDVLLAWLRERPLLVYDTALDTVFVHAGLHPQWDAPTCRALAAEVEAALTGEDSRLFLQTMYGDAPTRWHDDLRGWERLRCITNIMTRMRYLGRDGAVDLSHSGPPGSQPRTLLPWFQCPGRRNRNVRVVFGHWSSLGRWNGDGVIGLDSGCVWGRQLTAARLDAGAATFFSVSCAGA